MMVRIGALSALALSIAACAADEKGELPDGVKTEANQSLPIAKPGTPSPTPIATSSTAVREELPIIGELPPKDIKPTTVNTIPARFHGVWDYVEGTCAGESDARKEISAKEIMFYESIGTVTSVTAEGDDVLVGLDMEGEGETWTQVTRLSLSGSGANERLNTSDGEKPKIDNNFPSKRCAA